MAQNPPRGSSSAPGGGGWKIEYQQESVDLGPDGRAVAGIKVGFSTAKGNHASIFVPKAQYRLEAVRDAVSRAAAEIDRIHDLTG